MKHKTMRIIVILGVLLVSYVGVFAYAGKEWISYLNGAVSLTSQDKEELKANTYVSLYLKNLQAFFYGTSGDGEESIFVITEWNHDYLVICLNAAENAYAILRWEEENFDYDTQVTHFDFGELKGTLLKMDDELKKFILDTQDIYLGNDLEMRLLPFVFVKDQVGSLTYQELDTVTILVAGITIVGVFGIVAALLIPIKKKGKTVIIEEEKESE